ncbi:ankyrin repeat domain-containing protein [Streptantibioticus rubrisoli]|uniref:Ankyrin repeat domain-containing protein n=1 Tax=Streptantibioticus rubrisoli TaxID=1387313 RepID=A0ABT1P682_9ACTN|nr:ankyrin repeat domain-containing protein [Streptantibioticus rubrisoli]MCQ4040865.1 ankyrin repeat domain-containing protein [Streptantibioticus rubrisoli]
MVAVRGDGWTGMGCEEWRDYGSIRRRLDQGADPEAWSGGRPLHRAAVFGSPDVVAELARRVADVDALENGTTALWEAVVSRRPDNARALAAAGADPWRPLIGGWSAGRLSLAGPTPDLFALSEGERGLTAAERALAQEGSRLITALGDIYYEGTGLACVAGIHAEEAIRRLAGKPATTEELDVLLAAPHEYDPDEALRIVGVTTVPGGCVITQPWGYAPTAPGVLTRLSVGTVCYGMYANPKSGNQGSIVRDKTIEGWDLHPGGGPNLDDTPDEVLVSYLYDCNPVAYSCDRVGLRLTDARAVVGPPDTWVELPWRDYWEEWKNWEL